MIGIKKNGNRKSLHCVIGAWNVRTILDQSSSDRPDIRTAVVGKELSSYNIDITALKYALLMRDSSRELAIDTLSSGLVAPQCREHLGSPKESPGIGA